MENVEKYIKEKKLQFDTKKLFKNHNQKIAVMCYAENEENEILMLERIKEPFSGKLVPPGGKVETNEDIEKAIRREFLEETGFILNDLKLKVFTSEEGPEHYNWILFIFLGKIKKRKLNYCNEGILKWIKKNKLLEENLTNIDKKILPYLYEKKGLFFIEINYDENKNAEILHVEKIETY
ncbi:8-oxo-dGTP diphosphatase [Marinitoga hydrogenitolerans DSM 16785]|uniref:8-oxo-dGTP diphosphatase n=1 Tax=Marinitoga hydrogenitolerans (strain DSM 16785 / JCM 12826 / AT1271) TaxID=1122195 RepID=A0A1M4SXL9_MARH1|nr:NUDIX domain-containing protein [Marinitoga hydrogenitolerans]SHE36899.1 8-oxo-dGTP diphosphatase [Marinitoga hydrogenitolerans DSM 16785]